MHLAKLLGLGEIATLAKWATRLVVMGVLLILLIAAVVTLIFSESARTVAMVIVVVGVSAAVFHALWVRRERGAVVRERTIDGKLVPEMLAVAALDIPEESPDIDYVLRGLPDYGKLLLKLDTAEFAYVPEPTPETVPDQPLVEPVVNRPWLGVPRWVAATGLFVVATTLLIVAGVGMLQGNEGARKSPAPIQNVPPTVAAAAVQQQTIAAPSKPAQTLDDSPLTPEQVRATLALRPLAERGDAQAQYVLAIMYANHAQQLNLSQDAARKEANKLLLQAAGQSYLDAEYMTGLSYETGLNGFPQNPTLAAQWLRKFVAEAPADSKARKGALEELERLEPGSHSVNQ